MPMIFESVEETELAELRADKARLDWMERHRAGAEYNDRIASFTVQRYQQVCGCIGDGQKLREAIDAARNVQP